MKRDFIGAKAFWKPVSDFQGDDGPLYPDGLLEPLVAGRATDPVERR